MKKHLLCFLLALLLLVVLVSQVFGYSSFQDFLKQTNRLQGVNYNRIKQDTRKYIRVTFEIGSRSFHGMLKKGYRLEDQEADSIIRSVMLEFGLNTTTLTLHEMAIAEAEKIDPAFQTQFWVELLGQALGAGDAMAYNDLISGKISGTEYVVGQMKSELVSQGASAFAEATALSPAGAFILNVVTNCAEPAAKEALKAVRNDQIKQKAIASAAILDAFYQRCNQRLKEEAEKKDDTSWHLTGNSTEKVKRMFMGAEVVQTWEFTCDLKIKTPLSDDQDSPGGIYAGIMCIDITHDMTKFDGKYLWDVVNTFPILPEIKQKCPWQSFYDCWQGKSKLVKQLFAQNVQFVIPDNVEKYAKDADIDEINISSFFKSREDFFSMHPIWLVPDGVVPMVDKNGRYSLPYTEGQLATVIYLMGEFGEDNMSPQIYVMSSNMQAWQTTNAPHFNKTIDLGILNTGGVIKINHDIFSDLQSGVIKLKMGWKEENV